MTAHNTAAIGEIADRILLPGDPLRAKYIAEHFLENAQCVNTVRSMLAYTGSYRDKRVSVMGTGMGMPSMGIYAHELMEIYQVKRLIRVGTCGSISERAALRDVVLAMGSCTDSSMNESRLPGIHYAPIADYSLLKAAQETAEAMGVNAQVGNVFTSDKFYDEHFDALMPRLRQYGVLAVDMETCELYTLAARFGAHALSILTVSDSLLSQEQCSTEERQTTFHSMMRIALEIL